MHTGMAARVTDKLWKSMSGEKKERRKHMAELNATITCPNCGHAKIEVMPLDHCVYFYECAGCHAILNAKPGHCCVFCSYADRPCPVIQPTRNCCDNSN